MGDRQVLELLALIQGVGRRVLTFVDRTRPLLPRSRGGIPSAFPAGFLPRCAGPALDLTAGLLSLSTGAALARPASGSLPDGSGDSGVAVSRGPASADSATSNAARWALTNFRCTSASAKCSSEGCRCPSAYRRWVSAVATCSSVVISVPVDVSCISDGAGLSPRSTICRAARG
jgi:hypothetical protein